MVLTLASKKAGLSFLSLPWRSILLHSAKQTNRILHFGSNSIQQLHQTAISIHSIRSSVFTRQPNLRNPVHFGLEISIPSWKTHGMNTFDDLIDWITPQFASSQTRLTESAGAQAPKRDWNNLDAFVFSDFWELQRRDFIGWESVVSGRKKGIDYIFYLRNLTNSESSVCMEFGRKRWIRWIKRWIRKIVPSNMHPATTSFFPVLFASLYRVRKLWIDLSRTVQVLITLYVKCFESSTKHQPLPCLLWCYTPLVREPLSSSLHPKYYASSRMCVHTPFLHPDSKSIRIEMALLAHFSYRAINHTLHIKIESQANIDHTLHWEEKKRSHFPAPSHSDCSEASYHLSAPCEAFPTNIQQINKKTNYKRKGRMALRCSFLYSSP